MTIPGYWRLREQRYRLEGSECGRCGTVAFPPREVCRACRGRAMVARPLRGEGTLASFTVVHQPPAGFEAQAPYAVGLVDLADGPRVTAMLTDADLDELRIGLAVEMVVRKLSEDGPEGVIFYGYKFRPVWG